MFFKKNNIQKIKKNKIFLDFCDKFPNDKVDIIEYISYLGEDFFNRNGIGDDLIVSVLDYFVKAYRNLEEDL